MLHNIDLRQKIIVMAAVMSGLFLVALDQTIIATALTKIVEEFNSFTSLSWIVTAYLLTTTITVPIAGKFSDMFGRRLMLIIGVSVFTLTSLLTGSSQSIEQLIIFRALQGIGGGIITANAFTIIGDLFSPRERGRWQGIIGAVFGISSIIGPLLGGYLTDSHTILGLVTSWRWNFWINVPIGAIALFMIIRYCPAIKHEQKPKIDYLGASLLALALASIILGVDNTEQIFADFIAAGVNATMLKVGLYLIATLALAAFVWVESKAKEPIIPLRFFANRTFSAVMAVALLFGAAFLGAILYLTQFNQQVFEATATTAGLMLLPMVGGLVITSAVTGQIVSRTGKYKWLLLGGLALATVSVFSLSTLTATSPYFQEAIIMAFVGIGLGTGMPIMNLAVQNEFSQRDLGAATASSQLLRGLGSTIGVAILGSVMTASVADSLNFLEQTPYIQTLQQQPQAKQFIGQELDANTILNLNQPDIRHKINHQATQAIQNSGLSQPAQERVVQQFQDSQVQFSKQVANVFSNSLHDVFFISTILMLGALIAASFVEEKPLRNTIDETPGVG